MEKRKKKTGKKKLTRQLVVMVFFVQTIAVALFCYLLNYSCIKTYLSAKNDVIKNDLHNYEEFLYYYSWTNWGLDYIIANTDDLVNDLTLEDLTYGNEFFYDLYTYSDEEALEMLENLTPEEKHEVAKGVFERLYHSFTQAFDPYGYDGCGFIVNLGNGRYLTINGYTIIEMEKGLEDINDVIIDESNALYDLYIADIEAKNFSDEDANAVDFYSYEVEEDGETKEYYVGLAPIIFDGQIKGMGFIRYDFAAIHQRVDDVTNIIFAIFIVANMLVCATFIFRTRRIATKPVTKIQNAVREYMVTKDGESARKVLKDVYKKNEIGVLAEDVDKMITEIDDYVGEIEEAGVKLQTFTKEVMEALVQTIDAKDPYTNGHSTRVAKYSRMIAEKLGMPAREVEDIYYMGLLHDIGKIGVSRAIINKTTSLNDQEYDAMKHHPITGYEILSQIHSIPDLALGARWHHERYDGKGYPDGKKGEEIPFSVRIIAVADTYDAMASNRSYRKYMPQADIRAEIEKNIGTQFDPDAAKAMLEIIDEDTEYKLHE